MSQPSRTTSIPLEIDTESLYFRAAFDLMKEVLKHEGMRASPSDIGTMLAARAINAKTCPVDIDSAAFAFDRRVYKEIGPNPSDVWDYLED